VLLYCLIPCMLRSVLRCAVILTLYLPPAGDVPRA
jgi:hypothetical protein